MHALNDIVNINGCEYILSALIKSSKYWNGNVLFAILKPLIVFDNCK